MSDSKHQLILHPRGHSSVRHPPPRHVLRTPARKERKVIGRRATGADESGGVQRQPRDDHSLRHNRQQARVASAWAVARWVCLELALLSGAASSVRARPTVLCVPLLSAAPSLSAVQPPPMDRHQANKVKPRSSLVECVCACSWWLVFVQSSAPCLSAPPTVALRCLLIDAGRTTRRQPNTRCWNDITECRFGVDPHGHSSSLHSAAIDVTRWRTRRWTQLQRKSSRCCIVAIHCHIRCCHCGWRRWTLALLCQSALLVAVVAVVVPFQLQLQLQRPRNARTGHHRAQSEQHDGSFSFRVTLLPLLLIRLQRRRVLVPHDPAASTHALCTIQIRHQQRRRACKQHEHANRKDGQRFRHMRNTHRPIKQRRRRHECKCECHRSLCGCLRCSFLFFIRRCRHPVVV